MVKEVAEEATEAVSEVRAAEVVVAEVEVDSNNSKVPPEVHATIQTLPNPAVTAIIDMATKVTTVSPLSPVPGSPRSSPNHRNSTSLETATKTDQNK